MPTLPTQYRNNLGLYFLNLRNIFKTIDTYIFIWDFFYYWFKYKTSADETINRLLNWILVSSANTLPYITIEHFNNELTKIPQQIPLFKALKYLQLHNDHFCQIRSGSLNFSVPVTILSFQDNQIDRKNRLIEHSSFFENVKI